MERLDNKDLRLLLESIGVLHSDISLASLPTRLFDAVSSSVTSEIIAFDEWQRPGLYTGALWYNPTDWMTPELMETFGAFAAEHPLVFPLIINDYATALKISDVLAARQFHRTGLYNEFYRAIDIGEQLSASLEVAPNLKVSCTLNRDRRGFSERDRLMINMLRPHLESAIRSARVLEQAECEREYLARVATKGIIVLDRKGSLKFMSGLAQLLLQKYFRVRKCEILPDDLRAYVNAQVRLVNGQDYFEPSNLFHVANGNSELQVRLVFDLNHDELKLILDESRQLLPDEFIKVGLTKRESEVLYWITMGKTDEVIATICGSSTRTVQKHAEHIRQRFNVETRTGAVRCALELLHKLELSAQIEL